MFDRKRKLDQQRRLPLLFVSLCLYFSVAAADTLKDLSNFPICSQACYTEALALCTPKCKITDFNCICACSSFQDNVKKCVSSSCATSHLQEAVDFITTNCKALNPITTSTRGSTSKTTSSTSTSTSKPSSLKPSSTIPSVTSGVTSHINGPVQTSASGIFAPSASPGWTTTYTGPAGPRPTSLGDTPPGGGPASVIGPACVPIHGLPNSSYPSQTNWTNGIIFVNGTWRNSSCVAANGTAGLGYSYEQVGVNEAALVRTGSWLAVALCVVMALMVWLG